MSSPDTRGANATNPSGRGTSDLASSAMTDTTQSTSPTPRTNTPSLRNQEQSVTGQESQISGTNQGDDQPCQSCGAPGRFECSACKSIRYCSQECQAEDWRMHYR